ncbi:hypothetical protein GCM10027289_24770 [Tsukamurella serpentis]
MSADWFRSSRWSERIEADFEQRLRRARAYNRPSYLRIQGVHLSRAGLLEPARALWMRVVGMGSGPQSHGEWGSAVEALADSYRIDDPAVAERWYRLLLTEIPSLNGTSGCAELSLAEVLAAQGRPDEALEAVYAWRTRATSPWPAQLFRSCVVSADIALAQGDRRTARDEARRALRVARLSPSTGHPAISVVRTDAATLRRLRRIGRRWWIL